MLEFTELATGFIMEFDGKYRVVFSKGLQNSFCVCYGKSKLNSSSQSLTEAKILEDCLGIYLLSNTFSRLIHNIHDSYPD